MVLQHFRSFTVQLARQEVLEAFQERDVYAVSCQGARGFQTENPAADTHAVQARLQRFQ